MILYFLVHSDGEKFKIGIAENFRPRFAALKITYGEFDLSRSLAIKCDKPTAIEFERLMHFALDKWRVALPVDGNGCTEWFSTGCLETARNLTMQLISLRAHDSFEILDTRFLLRRERKMRTPYSGDENNLRRPTKNATEFLRSALKDGKRPSDEIWQEAQKIGISHRAFNDAKKVLNVIACKEGNTGAARWFLHLTLD